VACALGRFFYERGYTVSAVASRSRERAFSAAASISPSTTATRYADLPRHATHILIAVSDVAIADVARMLAGPAMRGGVALHTSGTGGLETLQALAAAGAHCGSLHPLQTISDLERGVLGLCGAAFAVDGDETALAWAHELVRAAEGRPLRIAESDRAAYHAAAVLAGNYLITLLDTAAAVFESIGIPRGQALLALAPLARASLENAVVDGPEGALTGPISRGDVETVQAHLAILPPDVRELYRTCGLSTIEVARRQGLPGEAAVALERVLRQN